MTLVQVLRSGGRLVGFKAKGHTGYAQAGQDIVCAGVSTLIQTAVLGLQELAGLDLEIKQEQKSGFFSCFIVTTDDETKLAKADLILNLMYLGLQQIALDYQKYVQIVLKEVQKDEF
ncbi:MAG TPA: ribosomal-processing cysteine protease Prp [Firmicutes bacterium]|jgi:uncharacterized protein YsxB (DUF464 family)|nr:ribosomal-processing cysteine protease Prp [Bacillota bacterium]